MVKTFDDEIIENCAVDEIEAEVQESDEINSRVMDLLRLKNEATTPKDDNAGISTVPTTNVSETTSSGSNANENTLSDFQQSTTPSGSSGTSTLAFENGEIQSFDAPSTSHVGVMQSSDSPASSQGSFEN